MREGFVLSGGAQLYYQIHGEGAPVLLLHGNGEDLHCFDQQIGVLAKRCQAVLLESRGHGRSTHGDGVVSIRQIALDAQAVIDALGLQAPVVVGFSDGANAAIQLALDCPQKLGGLVLAGANLEPAGVRASVQAPITIGYGVCRFLGLFSKKAREKSEILGLMVKGPHYQPQQLKKISLPTLVLAGDKDLIKEEHTRLIAGSIPHAQLCIIPNADHFIFARQPQRVNRELLSFFEQVAGR